MSRIKHGFGITLIPASWAFGVWRKPQKTLLAVGPVRFVHYRIRGAWRKNEHTAT